MDQENEENPNRDNAEKIQKERNGLRERRTGRATRRVRDEGGRSRRRGPLQNGRSLAMWVRIGNPQISKEEVKISEWGEREVEQWKGEEEGENQQLFVGVRDVGPRAPGQPQYRMKMWGRERESERTALLRSTG